MGPPRAFGVPLLSPAIPRHAEHFTHHRRRDHPRRAVLHLRFRHLAQWHADPLPPLGLWSHGSASILGDLRVLHLLFRDGPSHVVGARPYRFQERYDRWPFGNGSWCSALRSCSVLPIVSALSVGALHHRFRAHLVADGEQSIYHHRGSVGKCCTTHQHHGHLQQGGGHPRTHDPWCARPC